MVFVSVRGRILMNAEALNMAEAIGNYIKHRRVPVLLPQGSSYVLAFAPAISGEAIAHYYQELLVEKASEKGLPVCKLCKMKTFVKNTTRKTIEFNFGKEVSGKKGDDLTLTIIRNCVVEDIGGFLVAEEENVRRTSSFNVGYMIPTIEAVKFSVVEAQLHTRQASGLPQELREKLEGGSQRRGKLKLQSIYYIEVASGAYTFSFDLDLDVVGAYVTSEGEKKELENAKKRKELALEALQEMLTELGFGGKRTRFLPNVEWESLVIAVSDKTWTVPSPMSRNYIEKAKKKKEKLDKNTQLFIFPEMDLYDVITNAISEATERIERIR